MGALHFDIKVQTWHPHIPGTDGSYPGWHSTHESFGVTSVPETAEYNLKSLKKIDPKRRRQLVEELAVAVDYILQHLDDEE